MIIIAYYLLLTTDIIIITRAKQENKLHEECGGDRWLT
jgi:hypothetical protein